MSNDRGAPTGQWRLSAKFEDRGPVIANLRLTVCRPDVPDVEIELKADEFVIGRATQGVDLTLEDDLVSRKHAKLSVKENGYVMLEDLGSKNGITYSERTVRRLNLVDGDEFYIGKAKFLFRAEMKRFKKVEPPKPIRIRADSVFVEIPVPEPKKAAVVKDTTPDDAVGWNPDAARASDIPDPSPSEEAPPSDNQPEAKEGGS
ncbi:MAG: FHA domain-containing protein [Myxococcota bacterium]